MMPRSRQMSAMTAPIGRRRTQAAICSGVGRPGSTPGALSGGLTAGLGRAAIGGGRQRAAARARRLAGGCADDPGFECLGTEQAAGDAREDQGDIAGAERVGVAAERGGELPAVVDEPTDEAEKAAGAAGFGVGAASAADMRHTSTGLGSASRNLFLVTSQPDVNCGSRGRKRNGGTGEAVRARDETKFVDGG